MRVDSVRAISFTKRQLVFVIKMHNLAFFIERSGNKAPTAEHAVATEPLVEVIEMSHAI